jgi:hypothetical protein
VYKWVRKVIITIERTTDMTASILAPQADLGAVLADLFDLDMQEDDDPEAPSSGCSADCTNDGCTNPSKC